MKAALCKSLDGPDGIVIEEVAEPAAGPGEVVIEVRAAALNFSDTLITRGKYQSKPALPFSPSGEVAGIVSRLGPGARGLDIGSRVAAVVGWGGACERVAVAANAAVPVPPHVSDVVAAGAGVTYGTAIHGLKERGRLAPGETVAVLGASGGAGLAAIEIAKLMGARVIAAASSAEKLEICRTHGADFLVNYSDSDLKRGLREPTDGRGVDVIYDCVGGSCTEAAVRALAWRGRLLVVGFATGEIPRLPLNLLMLKGAEAVGVFWGEALKRDPAAHRTNMVQVFEWVAAGKLRPRVHATYPLAETAEAIRVLDRREARGKVVLVL